MFQQAVERSQRIVLGIGAGLVDLVHHDDRVGVLPVDQRLKHLARFGAFPLGGRTREQPAGGHAAHGDQAHAGAQQIGDLAGKVRLADARWPQQEHGGHLQAVVTVLAQGHVPPDVVQRIGEVGQLLVQRRHVGDTRWLDGKALGSTIQHPLPGVAQRFLIPISASVLKLGQLALDIAGVKHAAHAGDRQADRREGNEAA